MVFEAMLRVGAHLQAPAIASGSTEMASVYYLSKYISKGSTGRHTQVCHMEVSQAGVS